MNILKLGAGLALASTLLAAAPAAEAGCLGGAVVGGVGGHFAGHHALLGAAAGCAIGHHMAVVKKRQRMAMRQQTVTVRH
jgi:hypothetical protein